jgi:hypothetical protein
MRRGSAWLVANGSDLAVGGAALPIEIDRLLLHGFAALLADRGGVVAHAAAVAGPRGAVAFVGPSGAGKTTAALNCPAPLIHPDRVAVGMAGSAAWLAPVPFLYAEPKNGDVGRRPLDRIGIVTQGLENRVTVLSVGEASRSLLTAVLVPSDPARASAVLEIVLALASCVTVASVEARIDGGFWPLLVGGESHCNAEGGSVP